ncbi:MAG: hypothetical protein U1E26_08655 [Coriobacteriia bacterium]|nr:hypothetical protein [Coriobacteriia bacterium]
MDKDVAIEESVPKCYALQHSDAAVLATILGFVVMTGLDLALG